MFICVECGLEKEDSEFYKAANKRGLTSKCKDCVKAQVKRHRENNLDKVREYDRNRPNHYERLEQNKTRYKNKRLSGDEDFLNRDRLRINTFRNKHPEKASAHKEVNKAIKDGTLLRPYVCSNCGCSCTPDAHHSSYEESCWLDVIWLCKRCHSDLHKKLNETKRKEVVINQ